MEPEIMEQVQVNEEVKPEDVEVKVEEAEMELCEPVYEVKCDEMVADYLKLKEEKVNELDRALLELDKRVAERLEALRPEIEEQVRVEIKKEVEGQYAEKLAMYEKYIVEVKSEEIEMTEELKEQIEEQVEERLEEDAVEEVKSEELVQPQM